MQHADTLICAECDQTILTNVHISPLPLPTLKCFANVLRHCELHLGNYMLGIADDVTLCICMQQMIE